MADREHRERNRAIVRAQSVLCRAAALCLIAGNLSFPMSWLVLKPSSAMCGLV